jgi:hypothetical protein
VDNIKMDLVEIACGGVDRFGLVQGRDKRRDFGNAVINLGIP